MSESGFPKLDTPRKARLKGAAEFIDAKGILYLHTDLFNFYRVSKTCGWAILAEESEANDRRLQNNLEKPKTRGRKPLLSPKQIR